MRGGRACVLQLKICTLLPVPRRSFLQLRSRVSVTFSVPQYHSRGIIGHLCDQGPRITPGCAPGHEIGPTVYKKKNKKKEERTVGQDQLSENTCIAVSSVYRLDSTCLSRRFPAGTGMRILHQQRREEKRLEIHGPQPCIHSDNMLCYFYRLNCAGQ